MLNFFGCCAVKLEGYCSKDPMINVCMDYISGWKHDEVRGAYGSHAQVLFFPEGKSKALIDLTVQEASKINISPLSLDAVVNDLVVRRLRIREAKLLSKKTKTVLESGAVDVELSYLVPEDRLSVKSKYILVREKAVILEKDRKFYFLRYENSAKEFNKYRSAFKRIAGSMKLKEGK